MEQRHRSFLNTHSQSVAKAKRQGRPPPFVFLNVGVIALVDGFLQFRACAEFGNFARGNLDGGPGLRITSVASFLDETENVPKPISATRSPFSMQR
jgi:hypothetical protein